MGSWNTTTTALLEGLRNAEDVEAWRELEARVRPVVFALARRSGLDGHVAADVAQETLVTFLGLYRQGRYQRERGRLGSWIVGIARNAIRAARRSDAGRERRLETVEAQVLGRPNELETIWEEESRSALMHAALERLEGETDTDPVTVEAFRRTFLDGASPQEVADDLGLTVNSVYLAKNRCLARLRVIVERMERTWELHL